MLKATTVSNKEELQQILQLQQKNLVHQTDAATMQSEGFVTMQHSPEVLQQMHELSPGIIIKDDAIVAGYALVMLRACRQLFPPLEPMFEVFDKLYLDNKPLNDYSFYVMGQICIDKKYRGKGLFDMLYNAHRSIHSAQFDFILTEVSTRNTRSMRAHQRIGFKTIHTYKDHLDEWAVILWDWK